MLQENGYRYKLQNLSVQSNYQIKEERLPNPIDLFSNWHTKRFEDCWPYVSKYWFDILKAAYIEDCNVDVLSIFHNERPVVLDIN